MGIALELWRSRIGCFIQPTKHRSRTTEMNLSSALTFLSFSIRLALFALLIAQCVEPNPGPPKQVKGDNREKTVRTRRTEKGSGVKYGMENNSTQETNISTQQSVSASTSYNSDQPRINEWLNQTQRTENIDSDNEDDFQSTNGNPDQTVEVSMVAMQILIDIQRNIKMLNSKFDKMEKTMVDLKSENESLKLENTNLKKQVESLDTKVENLEAQSRRENLKFYNIQESGKESWAESENKVRKYLTDDLHIDESKISIERAHRIGSQNKPRPVIVKFSFYKDKESFAGIP